VIGKNVVSKVRCDDENECLVAGPGHVAIWRVALFLFAGYFCSFFSKDCVIFVQQPGRCFGKEKYKKKLEMWAN